MKRIVLTLLLLSFSMAFVAGCHTVAGVGKDVKEAGEEVEETANGH
jgi:predicted small secreted protein